MIGSIPGMEVHWGLVFGIIAAILSYILIYHTVFGFAARVAGGNIRAAKVVGLSVGKLILIICFLAGAAAGLAGMMEVAAVQGRTNANLAAGYGFAGILVAFPRPAKSAGDHSGGDPARRHRRQRRSAAAAAGIAGRVGSGAAGHDLRDGARQRHALRALEPIQRERRPDHGRSRRYRIVDGAGRGAGRRDTSLDAVYFRQPRRMHYRAQRPHQSRP